MITHFPKEIGIISPICYPLSNRVSKFTQPFVTFHFLTGFHVPCKEKVNQPSIEKVQPPYFFDLIRRWKVLVNRGKKFHIMGCNIFHVTGTVAYHQTRIVKEQLQGSTIWVENLTRKKVQRGCFSRIKDVRGSGRFFEGVANAASPSRLHLRCYSPGPVTSKDVTGGGGHPAKVAPSGRRSSMLGLPLQEGGGGLKRRRVGVISITATGNNTLFTLSDRKGKLKSSVSAGSVGFRNSGKSALAGAEKGAARIISKAQDAGFQLLRIEMRGIGYTKVKALRAMVNTPLPILEIVEKTTRSHNGCRLPRKRRL